MDKKWLIPIYGLSLLIAIVLSGVLLISHPSVWNPMYQHVMGKDFKERQKLDDRSIEIRFEDAEKISGGLWNETPYTEISNSLKFRQTYSRKVYRMNDKEIYHYQDVREKISTAKWVTGVALLIAIIGFYQIGTRKIWNASIASSVLFGIIAGVWMMIYWRGLFRALHWVIFQDDSWIMPKGSYSLGLFPHKVWQTAGGMIAVFVFTILAIGFIVSRLTEKSES